MTQKLLITLGQDVSAYAVIAVPAGTDTSDANLSTIAKKAVEADTMFTPDWGTVCALRVVDVRTESGAYLREDVPVEPCCFDGGQVLRSFFSGQLPGAGIATLVNAAAKAKLIPEPDLVTGTGFITFPGCERIEVNFDVRKGATKVERDLAFLTALGKLAEDIGTVVPVGAS